MHNQSQKHHRSGIKIQISQEGRPQVLKEPTLCQEVQQEGPKEEASQQIQGHGHMCQGPHKTHEAQAQVLKEQQPQAQSTYLHCSFQPWEMCSFLLHQRFQALLAKLQGQGYNQGQAMVAAQAQAPKSAQALYKGSREEISVRRCENRRTGVTLRLQFAWGQCLPVLFVQLNLRQELSVQKVS